MITILADRETYPINAIPDCVSAKQLQPGITTGVIMLTEQFKQIKGYEGLYEISNYGRIKGLNRMALGRNKCLRTLKEKILKNNLGKRGYFLVGLCKKSNRKFFAVHRLVWDHFGDRSRDGKEVDHIKENSKQNNRIDNLQLLTHRENCSKSKLFYRENNLPTGVYRYQQKDRYYAKVQINGKIKYLGMYNDINKAAKVYQNKLEEFDIVRRNIK